MPSLNASLAVSKLVTDVLKSLSVGCILRKDEHNALKRTIAKNMRALSLKEFKLSVILGCRPILGVITRYGGRLIWQFELPD